MTVPLAALGDAGNGRLVICSHAKLFVLVAKAEKVESWAYTRNLASQDRQPPFNLSTVHYCKRGRNATL
jgi:hypothetical protein